MQTLSFSFDAKLIDAATAYAEAQGTTLNDLLVNYVNELASRHRKEVAEQLARECREQAGCSEERWRFNREECHKRGDWM
jgi:hypothetical protein